jgi:hypothetical protein
MGRAAWLSLAAFAVGIFALFLVGRRGRDVELALGLAVEAFLAGPLRRGRDRQEPDQRARPAGGRI